MCSIKVFAACTCFSNTGYIMHTARWADIICVRIMYITCNHIIISDIICVRYKFLQHVPVPNTGYIMHAARGADIICCSICTSFLQHVPVPQYRLHHANSQMGYCHIYMCRAYTLKRYVICEMYLFSHTDYIMQLIHAKYIC
jgi:hypothetical protein